MKDKSIQSLLQIIDGMNPHGARVSARAEILRRFELFERACSEWIDFAKDIERDDPNSIGLKYHKAKIEYTRDALAAYKGESK